LSGVKPKATREQVVCLCVRSVCRSFLQQHQEHLEQLYEVAAPGDWTQRWNIWLSIQLGRYSLGADYIYFMFFLFVLML